MQTTDQSTEVTIKMPKEYIDRIETVASMSGVSRDDVVRVILTLYLLKEMS